MAECVEILVSIDALNQPEQRAIKQPDAAGDLQHKALRITIVQISCEFCCLTGKVIMSKGQK